MYELSNIPYGQVTETWVYPGNGMQGVKRENGIEIRKHSVVGDRRVGWARVATLTNGGQQLELLHTMDAPQLLMYQAGFADTDKPKDSEVIVTTPDGETLGAKDPKLTRELSERLGYWVMPMETGKNLNYSGAASMLSRETLEHLAQRVGHDLDPRNFRMNILFEHVFTPETVRVNKEVLLLEQELHFGQTFPRAILIGQAETPRCAAVNYSVDENGSLMKQPEILKAIPAESANPKEHNLGLYTSIKSNGLILPGAPIHLRV